MKNKFKKIFILLIIFGVSINKTNAWIGLVAETTDILNITKWNEMINLIDEKMEFSNLSASNYIILSNISNSITISSTGAYREVPYIKNTSTIQINNNVQSTIVINGTNFLPNSEIEIPGFTGTIDSFTVDFENKITIILTPSSTGTFDIIISNEGTKNTLWQNNGVGLLQVN